ncbi:MAG TPA: hypothetical protein VHV47_12475 [Opitutaceae bacterium]|jgi:hypothetical protein|nr:hypothetical protein [Opitutaceae bacterium]
MKKKKKRGVTTAQNLIRRFDAGKSVLDYFDTENIFHPNWGGSRPGAGRKSKGHVRLQLLVSPEVSAKIREKAWREKKTLSEVVAACF